MRYSKVESSLLAGKHIREDEHHFEVYLKDFGEIDGIPTKDLVHVDAHGHETPFLITIEHLLSDTWSVVEAETSTETTTETES